MERFDQTYQYKLIYVFSMPYETHKGLLKVGEATLSTDIKPNELVPNCHALNQAAKARIDSYTKTASISYKLEYTELALKLESGFSFPFKDKDVHKVLMNVGVHKVQPNGYSGEEWFETNLDTVKAAIEAVKKGQSTISSGTIIQQPTISPIEFREEQLDAIEKTIKTFRHSNEMLWYAKMRFGKTLTALEVIRRIQYRRVIIVTHRPVVDDGWSEDFKKIFYPGNSRNDYNYERKTKDSYYVFDEKTDAENDIKIRKLDKDGAYFIYFASIQDLRGSQKVGGTYNKNNAVFALDWDLIVIDEAHEGTQTELGDSVIKLLRKDKTKVLALSGTPFNLLNLYNDDNVYTWDYVMEQKKKAEWDMTHLGDHNPYGDLPKMHIYTYDLGERLKSFVADEYGTKAFNFKEFFRVWYRGPNNARELPPNAIEGRFVHEEDVNAFLDLMVKEDSESGYPFSTQEYRDMFRHTLWMVPGVKEAKALSELLRNHPVFGQKDENGRPLFGIANVAGEGDRYEEEHTKDALELVRSTIKKHRYSITLSCGKLTTGVTVKEWTAVFMISGSYSTAAAQYMQTIFRVQSAGSIDGKQKTDCFVFDFAPDRTLKVLTETVHLSRKPGKNQKRHREIMTEFLNFCPVISISGSRTKKYSVESMMEQIKQIYAERAVNSGFEDESLYNDELLKLDAIDASKFNALKDIIGTSKASKKPKTVVVNGQGLTDEEVEHVDDPEPDKPIPQLTPEEIEERRRIKQAKEARKRAIDILRGISIRMPLMIYGADVPIDEDIDIDSFVRIVDDESWKEFMPDGVTKELFVEFTKYYDRDVFIAAGKRIRRLAAEADKETPTRRVLQIAEIFRHFKNPDKETVLTPWRVVNLHMSETLGGWCFFNERFEDDTQEKRNRLKEPRFVDKGELTSRVFSENAHILEINSKTGLYPLYIAYSFYKQRMNGMNDDDREPDYCQACWNKVIRSNVFVICKTPMAKSITRRTLCGYNETAYNAHYFDDLINMLKNKPEQFRKRVLKGSYWKEEVMQMRFDAVVGNPPYQGESDNTRKPSIYPLFYDAAFNLSDFVTLISPARFLFNVGDTSKDWNSKMLNDEHFTVVKYFEHSQSIFPSVEIKGGVAITVRDANTDYGKIGIFTKSPEMRSVLEKVLSKNPDSIMDHISSRGIYRFTDEFFRDYPDALTKLGKGTGNMMASNVFSCAPAAFYSDKPKFDSVRILGLEGKRRTWKWIDRKYIISNEYLESYNVILSKVNGSGDFGEALTKPMVIGIGEGVTDTFISLGQFSSEYEAENLRKYILTKFARAMLGIKKVTQDNPGHFWEYVPNQDFSEDSDIDWMQSVSGIDMQLYEKYDLSPKEKAFIEDNVRPMDSDSDSDDQQVIDVSDEVEE